MCRSSSLAVRLVLLLWQILAPGCDGALDLGQLTQLALVPVRTFEHKGYRRFTEGLVFHQGYLYEGTGLVNHSALNQIEPVGGEVVRTRYLDEYLGADAYFGEGITIWKDILIQLSFREGRAHLYTLSFLKLATVHRYEGEGWGLTHDGASLIMSDGSSVLTFRDPTTFAVRRRLEVRADGVPVDRLNELEAVAGIIYANRFRETYLLAIDAQSGEVLAWVDASRLDCSAMEGHENVLNGIAYNAQSNHFFLTGKNCPTFHEVEWRWPK